MGVGFSLPWTRPKVPHIDAPPFLRNSRQKRGAALGPSKGGRA